MVSLLGPTFRENLTRPLVDQSKGKNPNGVDQVINFLDHYDLTKEDMDNILGSCQKNDFKVRMTLPTLYC